MVTNGRVPREVKIHLVIQATVLAMTGFLFSGCTTQGKKLTTSGYAWEPQIAWNGSHFGMVYFHRPDSKSSASVHAVKIDLKGNLLQSKPKLAQLAYQLSYGDPYRISNLVWNPNNKQFAFAVAAKDGKEVTVFLLDANCSVIGKPLVFGPLFKTPPLRNYIDLSLTWNPAIKEYAVAYILEKHPYMTVNSEVAMSRFTPQGKVAQAGFVFIPFSCSQDCSRTSITADPKAGHYAIAYFCGKDVMLGFVDKTYLKKSEHKIMSGWQSNSDADAIRVVYDKESGQYVVAAIKGTELAYQIIHANGKTASQVFVRGKGYEPVFSLDKLGYAKHSQFVCATKGSQVFGWPIYSTGHEKTDLVALASSTKHPSVALVNVLTPYIAWIESGLLWFGEAN